MPRARRSGLWGEFARIVGEATAAEAAQSAREFEGVERDLPDQIDVTVEGRGVYVGTIEEPAVLSLTEFEEAVAAATG